MRTSRNWAVVKDAESKTLCGAPVTEYDVSYFYGGTKKFQADTFRAEQGWVACSACMAKRRVA